MNFNASSAPATASLATAQPVSSGYKVDITRGERIGRVSSEWFSRPYDERYLSLSELYAAVHARSDRARTRTCEAHCTHDRALHGIGPRLHESKARQGLIEAFQIPRFPLASLAAH